VTQRKNVSEATAKVIDEEIRRIVEQGEATARAIITEHMNDLHTIAKGLLEYETLSREDIETLLAGHTIDRHTSTDEAPRQQSGPRSSVPASGRAGRPGGLEPEPQPGS
jgi:cell division protease FtsH